MENMSIDEMIRKYQTAEGIREQKEMIRIIAELNDTSYADIADILITAGCDVPKQHKRKIPEPAPRRSVPDAVRAIIEGRIDQLTTYIDELIKERRELEEFLA